MTTVITAHRARRIGHLVWGRMGHRAGRVFGWGPGFIEVAWRHRFAGVYR